MKVILLILILVSANLFASTIDQHSFPVLGTDSIENFQLTTTQTRINYKQETVAQTCFRSEITGYRNVCNSHLERRCYETRDSARICRNEPVTSCQQIADYRQVPYTCYQNISTPIEVVDHQVKANIKVIINRPPKEPTDPMGSANCLMNFSMQGDELKPSADCNDFLIFSNQEMTSSRNQEVVIRDYNFNINLLDTQSTLAPLEGAIADMHLEGHVLIFRTGDLTKNKDFFLKLFVERNYVLKSDETLINRNLTVNEYSFEKINERFGLVKIDLDKLLGGINDKRKHTIKVNLSLSLPNATLLNRNIPAFSVDSSITFNN